MIEDTAYESDTTATAVQEAPASNEPDYWPELANQQFEKGNFRLAVDLCVENLSGGKSDPLSGYLIKGKALLALGKLEEAAEEFHLALGRDPSSPMALKYLGDIRFAYSAEAVAFSYYERALKSQSMSGGLFSNLSGAPERALRERLIGSSDNSFSTDSVSDSELNLPEIEIVPIEPVSEEPVPDVSVSEESVPDVSAPEVSVPDLSVPEESVPDVPVPDLSDVPVASVVEAPAPEAAADSQAVEPDSQKPPSLTFRRAPERSTTVDKAPESNIPKDIPRFDRLAMAPEYHTRTMADLLLRQGHARAAQSVLKTLVARDATPELIEKLKEAESIAGAKGQ